MCDIVSCVLWPHLMDTLYTYILYIYICSMDAHVHAGRARSTVVLWLQALAQAEADCA